MNKKQILWILKKCQALIENFDGDYDELKRQVDGITSGAKNNEYARMIVLDVIEALEVGENG